MHLYPNQWNLVKKIEDSESGDILRIPEK
jgi:hypothetical protein